MVDLFIKHNKFVYLMNMGKRELFSMPLLGILFISLFFVGLVMVGLTSSFNSNQLDIAKNTKSLVPHDSIVITEDNDFIVQGYPGNGAIDDPYIISNYEIIASNSYGIFIIDVTKCFTIRNCHIESNIDGTYIRNVFSNRTIIDGNTIENVGQHAICVMTSTNFTVVNNELDNGGAFGTGIKIMAPNSIIENNTVMNYYDGIITYGDNEVIVNNSIASCGRYGILASDGMNIFISNNMFNENLEDGIKLSTIDDSVIKNNSLIGNGGCGIELTAVYDTEIFCNTIIENDNYGIDTLDTSQNIVFHHNYFFHNSLDFESHPQASNGGSTNTSYNDNT